MAQVCTATCLACFPTPVVLRVVSQLPQECFCTKARGLIAPRAFLSTKLMFSSLHSGQFMAGAAGAVTAAAGLAISNGPPLSCPAEVNMGEAMVAAMARAIPQPASDVIIFIFFCFLSVWRKCYPPLCPAYAKPHHFPSSFFWREPNIY